MRLLIITKPKRYKEWQALFGMKAYNMSNDNVTISSVEQGSTFWEGVRFDIVLIEDDVMLNADQELCLRALHRTVAIAMKPADAFLAQRMVKEKRGERI